MKQVIQNIRNGQLSVAQVPEPTALPGQVLIANQASLVSAGTERMIIELSKKSLLGKARERPDQVRRVLEKIRHEGLLPTIQQVRTKLDEPMTMGYSSAGIVVACGAGVQEFKPGDRVASNGPHAEFVSVPRNLCAHVPENVSDEQAAFGVLGSIALQGVRLAQSEIGETVLVIGLGLVGQLTVGLLRAAGIKVFGTDPDSNRCALAEQMGAAVAMPSLSGGDIARRTYGLGVDAVIITASTKSNGPIELGVDAVRKKGRIVLVGAVGLELDRRPFYFKEVEFVVSCSYGPGRYDPDYEERGRDYPPAYVRWTEQRNIQAVLELMGRGSLDVSRLISHRFPLERAEEAYRLIESGHEPFLGVVLQYSPLVERQRDTSIGLRAMPRATRTDLSCGVLGAGNFARLVLLPLLEKSGKLHVAKICSAKGLSATHAAKSVSADVACSDEEEIFGDPQIGCVFSITRHDHHARHVIRAMETGKHIFVEKPLCISAEELYSIDEALQRCGSNPPMIMVGFNRRFSPAAQQIKEFFDGSNAPLTLSIRFNAGEIPADHWAQADGEGGGRIIGEACHAIDLATYLTGSLPRRIYAESIRVADSRSVSDDQCAILIRHDNGSVSSIGYYAGGDKAFPKERIEVFGGGRVGVIDDFRAVSLTRGGKTRRIKSAMRKGHAEEIESFARALSEGGPSPIRWPEIRAVSLAALMAVRSLREGVPIDL